MNRGYAGAEEKIVTVIENPGENVLKDLTKRIRDAEQKLVEAISKVKVADSENVKAAKTEEAKIRSDIAELTKVYGQMKAESDTTLARLRLEINKASEKLQTLREDFAKTDSKYQTKLRDLDKREEALRRKEKEAEIRLANSATVSSKISADELKLEERITATNVELSARKIALDNREEALVKRERALDKREVEISLREDAIHDKADAISAREVAVLAREAKALDTEADLDRRTIDVEKLEAREKASQILAKDLAGKEKQLQEDMSDVNLLRRSLQIKETNLKNREAILKEAQNAIGQS